MGTKHRDETEIRKILAEGHSGKESVRAICKRHKITEQTWYRWRKLYPEKPAARPTSLRDLLGSSKQAEIDDPSSLITGDEEGFDFDRDTMFTPGPPPPPGAPDPTPIAYDWAYRGSGPSVVVHGKLPRGDFEWVQVAVPKFLYRRLRRTVDGSLNQGIISLVRYALEQLDKEGDALHVFDSRKSKPKLPEPKIKTVKYLRRRHPISGNGS